MMAPHQLHLSQRWREKRTRFRPAGEIINPTAYEVAELDGDATAKAFILQHHYSATYPAARRRFGLFRHGLLEGVAVFSHPCRDDVLTNVFPGKATDSLELGRFVLLDSVPGNGESWFLARAFHLLRKEGFQGVVSFADPLPRRNAAGELITPGHVGIIYQAFNGAYLGQARPRTLHLLPNGTTFSTRAAQKIRRRDRGWRYAVEQLLAAGAPAPTGDLTAWLRATMGTLATVRHPGNHKYAWALTPRGRLVSALPYPRKEAL